MANPEFRQWKDTPPDLRLAEPPPKRRGTIPVVIVSVLLVMGAFAGGWLLRGDREVIKTRTQLDAVPIEYKVVPKSCVKAMHESLEVTRWANTALGAASAGMTATSNGNMTRLDDSMKTLRRLEPLAETGWEDYLSHSSHCLGYAEA